jgi:hypothetical protein
MVLGSLAKTFLEWCGLVIHAARSRFFFLGASHHQCICGEHETGDRSGALQRRAGCHLVGSTTPAFNRSSYLPVATLNPSFPLRFLTTWTIKAPSWPALLAKLPCLEIDSVPTAATVPPCGFSFTVSGMMISPFLTSLSSERLNQHAIAERFHIDCHMFCITPGSGPERCIQCCA